MMELSIAVKSQMKIIMDWKSLHDAWYSVKEVVFKQNIFEKPQYEFKI